MEQEELINCLKPLSVAISAVIVIIVIAKVRMIKTGTSLIMKPMKHFKILVDKKSMIVLISRSCFIPAKALEIFLKSVSLEYLATLYVLFAKIGATYRF